MIVENINILIAIILKVSTRRQSAHKEYENWYISMIVRPSKEEIDRKVYKMDKQQDYPEKNLIEYHIHFIEPFASRFIYYRTPYALIGSFKKHLVELEK